MERIVVNMIKGLIGRAKNHLPLSLVLLLMVILSAPVFAAYDYHVPISIFDNTATPVSNIPVLVTINSSNLNAEGYIQANALDTDVQESAPVPYSVATSRLGVFVSSLSAYQTKVYNYLLTFSPVQTDYPLIVGTGGNITRADAGAANLELGDNFTIEQDGWVDTSAGSDKNLIYKQGAFQTYISGATDITARILAETTTTFYPDPHIEVTSVDGYAETPELNGAWAALVAHSGAGGGSGDADLVIQVVRARADAVADQWDYIRRGIFLFDTSAIPNDAIITGATFSIKGDAKVDNLGAAPTINVYSSNPASDVALVPTDYATLGSIAFCDTPITYAGFDAAGYNDFVLNDIGISVIDVTGITKLGLRNANYDVTGIAPPYVANNEFSFQVVMADTALLTSDPKLVVTYEVPTVDVTASGISSGDMVVRVEQGGIASWWNTDWGSKEQLTFDNSASAVNLVDFPVLVYLDNTNFDFSEAQSNGEDIRFVDSDDSTPLEYLIDDWDDVNEKAQIWVKVPQIDSGSVVDHIFMYWTNPSASDNQNPEFVFGGYETISNCENIADWTAVGAVSVRSLDGAIFHEGAGSIKDAVTAQIATPYTLTYDPAGSWDFSDDGATIDFWFRSTTTEAPYASSRVYLYDTGGDNIYWDLTYIATTWIHFTKTLGEIDGGAGVFNDDVVDYFMLEIIEDGVAANFDFWVDQVEYRWGAILAGLYKGTGGASLNDVTRYDNDGAFTDVTFGQLATGLWIMEFNGATGVVNFGTATTIDIGSIDYSILAWGKGEAGIDVGAGIFCIQGVTTGTVYAEFRLSNSKPIITLYDRTNGPSSSEPTITMNDGVWRHLAATRDRGNLLSLYLDAILRDSDPDTATNEINNNTRTVLGGDRDVSDFWKGELALPRVYNYALSIDWIEADNLALTDTYITFGSQEINGLSIYIDGSLEDYTGGASVPDNGYTWYFNQNTVAPYIDFLKFTTPLGFQLWYQPVTMIVAHAVDRTGLGHHGTINWGVNQDGIEITIGAIVSTTAYIPPGGEEAEFPEVLPPPTDWNVTATNTTGITSFFLYELVNRSAISLGFSAQTMYVIIGLIAATGVGFGALIGAGNMLAFSIGFGATAGLFASTGVMPWWIIIIIILVVAMGIYSWRRG